MYASTVQFLANKHPTQVRLIWLVGCLMFAGRCVGGHSGGETPGHIPNPEAKPSSADGTAPDTVWESRTPPNYFMTRVARQGGPRCMYGPFQCLPFRRSQAR